MVLDVPALGPPSGILGAVDDVWFQWVTDLGVSGPELMQKARTSPSAAGQGFPARGRRVARPDCGIPQRWARRRKSSQSLALRSRIVLGCAEGAESERAEQRPLAGRPDGHRCRRAGQTVGGDHSSGRAVRPQRRVWAMPETSPVNQRKRMVKKQQMRRSPRGAHLLLQIRTRVLNDNPRRRLPALVSPLHPHRPGRTRPHSPHGLSRSPSGVETKLTGVSTTLTRRPTSSRGETTTTVPAVDACRSPRRIRRLRGPTCALGNGTTASWRP